MDAAVPGIFRGEPGEAPVGLDDRKALFRNQVSLQDLRAANVRIVVAALYAPIVISQLQGGYFKALLRQARAVEDWAGRHKDVRLVRSPDEAEAVLKSKDYGLGIVLAVEGGHGINSVGRLNTLWEKGVRLITIAHFSDSPWAGSAAVRYGPIGNCHPGGKDPGRNPRGLTLLGERLVDAALERGILIDLTHSSDKTVEDVARLHPDLPILFTHQGAREITPCERMIGAEELRAVKRSRGMVGLTFGSQYIGDKTEDFVRHAQAIARGAGEGALAFGSDYNGFVTRVEGAADSRGYAVLLAALERAGIKSVGSSAEAFVGLWRRSSGPSSRSR
jgi:membrane dipeptidase